MLVSLGMMAVMSTVNSFGSVVSGRGGCRFQDQNSSLSCRR